MNLQATENIRVFIDKGRYGNTPINATDVGEIHESRREDLSWKGCYYTIQKDEKFTFDRGNDWETFMDIDSSITHMETYGISYGYIEGIATMSVTDKGLKELEEMSNVVSIG